MREVLTRRFEHGLEEEKKLAEQGFDEENGSFTRYPDLIMMDGGKGQVHIAEEVLRKLHLTIPVCGMVKDDRHRTRGIYFQGEELPIDINSEGFHLMTRIQDEVHRFAIEYHRSLRSKVQVKSILDDNSSMSALLTASMEPNFFINARRLFPPIPGISSKIDFTCTLLRKER